MDLKFDCTFYNICTNIKKKAQTYVKKNSTKAEEHQDICNI